MLRHHTRMTLCYGICCVCAYSFSESEFSLARRAYNIQHPAYSCTCIASPKKRGGAIRTAAATFEPVLRGLVLLCSAHCSIITLCAILAKASTRAAVSISSARLSRLSRTICTSFVCVYGNLGRLSVASSSLSCHHRVAFAFPFVCSKRPRQSYTLHARVQTHR